MTICIIPARGGSKRIPRKNIRLFAGEPIIAFSIKAAISSGCFDRVIVSTDDNEIRSIAISLGAEVPVLRSDKNSDDHASVFDVVKETLDYLSYKENFSPRYVCCIFATAPFVTGKRIADAFEKMIKNNSDAVFPVVDFPYPIQRSLERKADGTVGMVWPEHLLSRSQDLPRRFHDAGQYYWVKTSQMLAEGTLFVSRSSVEHISPLVAQDIDAEEDWKIAELKFSLLSC